MPLAACIGTGNVGRSWAIVFARAGWDVTLWDAAPEAQAAALPAIAASCADLAASGLIEDAAAVLERVRIADNLDEAVRSAAYVQESTAELAPVKQEVFRRLDESAPADAILASSTSAIPGSAFMGGLSRPGRALVAHPVNPPHLIPLVELCPSPWTTPETVARTAEIMREVGQSPVTLTREIEGFVLNRLQWALLAEAMHLVGEGYCTPADIEATITDGLALRWSFIGPLEVGHLNASAGFVGYADGLAEAIGRVQRSLRTDYVPRRETIEQVQEAMAAVTPVARIPDAQLWRDRRIAALRKHRAEAERLMPRP